MNRNRPSCSMISFRSLRAARCRSSCLLALLLALPIATLAQQEPTLSSVTPADGAAGVTLTAPVVFVFSQPMDPDDTEAEFLNFSTFEPITALSSSWSADHRTLTYTPTQPWPAGTLIVWFVDGVDLEGEWLSEDELQLFGFFTTASANGNGNGDTGSNTNAVTSLIIGHVHAYLQESAAPPILDPDFGYEFFANTILASNRTATSVSLQLPTSETVNLLGGIFLQPWIFSFFDEADDAQSLAAAYPPGAYTFTIQDTATPDLVVTVNLPDQPQPNPPQITNYQDAQQIDPAQPFTLTWAPFEGGTITDAIQLEIEGFSIVDPLSGPVFQTPDPDQPGALPGTATSVVIPANTLEPDREYYAWLSFYRWSADTSNPTLWTAALRLTETDFTVATLGGDPVAGPISLANPSIGPGGSLSFDVISEPGQMLVIEAADRLDATEWFILLTAENGTGTLPFTDPQPATQSARFYRVRAL